MNQPPEPIVIKLLSNAPFRSNQIHERDRWLIEHAYNAGLNHHMTEQHPITPPPELIEQWLDEFYGGSAALASIEDAYIVKRTAEWRLQQCADELDGTS